MRVLLINVGLVCLFVLAAAVPAWAGAIDKSPSDVYAQTVILSALVEELRAKANVKAPWPKTPEQKNKAPRHVLQKALEVLKKINRLRKIKGMGALSVPPYPAREITPNGAFQVVERLVGEMRLLVPDAAIETAAKPPVAKTPADVYRRLWSVSRALDPLLGVRGFTPNDVHAQSVRIVGLVRFLRLTQNLLGDVKKPKRPLGKHPNHAIAAAYKLLARIAGAQKNLWMEPVQVPKPPRPVVTPTEVYDALQIVIAEMQRIKHRLGVQRHIPEPAPEKGKTPDDVIQNLQWAALLMPTFDSGRPLIQSDPASLARTPSDVFRVSEHILRELKRLKAARGNRAKPRVPPPISGLQPKHVYQKTLENLGKVNRLRQQAGLGAMVPPSQTLRAITPDEVYDLAVRLDAEMQIIYDKTNVTGTFSVSEEIFEDATNEKTPSDVYSNMWRISYLLDVILGGEGFTPTDVYRKTLEVVAEIKLISRHLNRYKDRLLPPLATGKSSADVIANATTVLLHIERIQRRAGIYAKQPPLPRQDEEVTPSDVYNLLSVVKAELITLKARLGVAEEPEPIEKALGNKTPSHVLQMLNFSHILLTDLLDFERHGVATP